MNTLRVTLLLAVVILMASCNPQQAWRKRSIEKKELALKESARKGKVDTASLRLLVADYDGYIKDYATDTTSANYMFKEGDYYRYIGKPQKSVTIYQSIYDGFQQYYKRPYALFMQGYTYENDIHNFDSAKVKYTLFLNNYPTHPIAKDVKLSLDNLGKTPDQLIAEFEARQKADSLAQVKK